MTTSEGAPRLAPKARTASGPRLGLPSRTAVPAALGAARARTAPGARVGPPGQTAVVAR